MNSTLLSVIMPCYNVESTFCRAIDSVLTQNTDFAYEIIIVNDCSTDNSSSIFEDYAKKHANVFVYENEKNSGKAEAFYQGLCRSQGDFFCVLDGDDYYTIADKLQRQINFFRRDAGEEYVAVAHKFIIDVNGRFNIPYFVDNGEYSYIDNITLNSFYYHTATYMFRNIFKGHIPCYMREAALRGDTALTLIQLMHTNKKVKILDFFGSAYVYTYKGIWSSLDTSGQAKISLSMYNRLSELVDTTFEKRAFNVIKGLYTSNSAHGQYSRFDTMSIDGAIASIRKDSERYACGSDGYIKKSIYYSQRIDTLVASLGYAWRVYHPEYINTVPKNSVAILCGDLHSIGQSILNELKDIIGMYKSSDVYVICTDNSTYSPDLHRELLDAGCRKVFYTPSDESAMEYFSQLLMRIAPYKTYYYAEYNNLYAVALMQANLCKNICVLPNNYGYICGIDIPALDSIIVRRPVDAGILKKSFEKKVLYIPAWGVHVDSVLQSKYCPFKDHSALRTASISYLGTITSVDALNRCPQMIVGLIEKTNGSHYHYGDLTKDSLNRVYALLDSKGISRDHFVHIKSIDNLSDLLLRHGIDILIEPYQDAPINETLEALSIGIPVIVYNGYTRNQIVDFVYSDCYTWNNEQEFIQILSSLTSSNLINQSLSAIAYYNATHDIDRVKKNFLNEDGLEIPTNSSCTNNLVYNINQFERVYSVVTSNYKLYDSKVKARLRSIVSKIYHKFF